MLRTVQSGFTLLELIVVVSVLAVVAMIGAGANWRVMETANTSLVRSEMQSIVKAVRQFRQDTGYYPKQGLFNIVSDCNGSTTGIDPDTVPNEADFQKEENFSQLLKRPDICGDHPAESWDQNTRRGWRGPYLHGFSLSVTEGGDHVSMINDPWGNAYRLYMTEINVDGCEAERPCLVSMGANGSEVHDSDDIGLSL